MYSMRASSEHQGVVTEADKSFAIGWPVPEVSKHGA